MIFPSRQWGSSGIQNICEKFDKTTSGFVSLDNKTSKKPPLLSGGGKDLRNHKGRSGVFFSCKGLWNITNTVLLPFRYGKRPAGYRYYDSPERPYLPVCPYSL